MMETIEHKSTADAAAPVTHDDPIVELCWRWGLRGGRVVAGWTIDAIERAERTKDLCVDLSRGPATIRTRLRAAGSEPRFARVGGVDLAHDAVDAHLNGDVAAVLKVLIAWLKRHDDGAALATLLAAMPEVAETPPPASGPAAWSGDPERAEHHQPATSAAPSPMPSYVVVHEPPPLDPAKKAPADRPVLGFQFIDVADLPRHADAFREIYNGTRGGLVVRGVYSPDEMARVVSRLERSQEKFPQMLLPASQKSYFLGLCLEGGDPTLAEYLTAAERFRSETLPVFEGMEPFESRVEWLFKQLSGGREVELVRFSDSRPYTPATIRILPEGGQLAPHCGNEMLNRPSYTHLHSLVDEYDQISYFLTLQEPEEGGGLIIYSLKWTDVGSDHILPDGRSNVGLLLAEAEWMEVRTKPGDVLMFDGGRYLHRVDWIKGKRTRWTMGGFLMFDKSGSKLFYWA